MKKVISIILSLVMLFSLLPVQAFAAEQYTDTAGNWAEGAIGRWSEYGVIEGSNGRFDPNGTLTRAQMAAILSRLLALPEAKSAGFSDVAQTDWFAPYINSCYASGIMQGSDGKAQPNDPITREQAIVMLSRALGVKPIENADLSGYSNANGATETTVEAQTLAALEHNYTVAQHDDSQHWMKCSRCDSTTEKTNHNYGAYTQTKAPACTEKGSEHAICSVCQHEDVREIAALGHDLMHHDAKAATCTEIGWDAYIDIFLSFQECNLHS